ncbi:MAG: hypothetical protein KGJ13_04325 [Patescibacteria group bacterium]|nr:hypothetical protein [Patescibacteria group bacterium]
MSKLHTGDSISAAQFRETRTKRHDLKPEDIFAAHLTAAKIPFERQYKFHPERKWRADFMIKSGGTSGAMYLCDIDGGTFSRSKLGHNSGAGIAKSFEKFNEAALLGFRVLRFDTPMVRDGVALNTVMRLLHGGKEWRPGKQR